MRTHITPQCPTSRSACTGKCQGYGSFPNCPPLIVIATLCVAQEAAR